MEVLQVIAAGFGAVAALCVLAALLHGRTAEAMRATPTIPTASVEREGTVEVIGVVRCLDPIDRPEVREHVAWFRYREYEEWESRGSSGRTSSWEDVTEETSEGRLFSVEDASGSIEVDPEGAEIDPEVLFEQRIEPDGVPVSDRGGRLVVRGKELAGLKEGEKVYVLGGATRVDGRWRISSAGGGPFRISTRPEAQQLSQMANADPYLWLTALVCAALAAAAYWAHTQGY